MSYLTVLKQADIFYKLTPTQLELIANLCQERSFGAGELIFPEGAGSDELYVIARGEVDIEINPTLPGSQLEIHPAPLKIATLRRGQSFGEIALVDQGFRSATARAAQNHTAVLIIPRKKLMALCDDYPQLGYILMRNLAVDLALKIRSNTLLIREELLYRKREQNS